jgi:hypothetical protein
MIVLLALPVALAVIFVLLYRHLEKQPDGRSLRRRTLQLGLGIGAGRAVLASLGWYGVEHTGGPLQIPAFALAMLAWPEAALVSTRRFTASPPEFYVSLSLLLLVSTVTLVSLVASAVRMARPPS